MPEVRVRGMTCQGCEEVVETAVSLLEGVEEASADRYEDVVSVTGDVSIEDVAEKIELAGYRALGPADEPTDGDDAASGAPGDAADEPVDEAHEELVEDEEEMVDEAPVEDAADLEE